MDDVYIVGAARSSIASVKRGKEPGDKNTSCISHLTPNELGACVRDDLLERSGIEAEIVEMFRMGSLVAQKAETSMFHAPAKSIMRKDGTGCAPHVNTATLEAACTTGLAAIEDAVEEIQLGRTSLAIAGGIEMMSRCLDEVVQGIITSPETGKTMAELADATSRDLGITKEELDWYAYQSCLLAHQHHNHPDPYRVPIVCGNGVTLALDEGTSKAFPLDVMRSSKLKLLPGCELITSAHASKYGDGAALVALASVDAIRKHNLKPIAKILAIEGYAVPNPAQFILAPNGAIPKALSRAGV